MPATSGLRQPRPPFTAMRPEVPLLDVVVARERSAERPPCSLDPLLSMNERIRTLLNGRQERLRRASGRELSSPQGDPAPLSAEDREHLLGDARDLYWNELEWEHLTGEEQMDDGAIVDLTFPGFLAYIRGLLLAETMPDSLAPASPRPEIVEDVLAFLAGRMVALKEEITGASQGEEQARLRMALVMTSRLLDLVLFELYALTPEEIASVDAQAAPEA